MKYVSWFMATVLTTGCLGRNQTVLFHTLAGVGGLQCTTPQNLVFQDEEAWQEFWYKNCNALDENGNILSPPVVNFRRHTLLGVFLGMRPTGGYGVTIKEIKKTPKELLVYIEERKPKPGMMVITVITYPYQLVTIEKTPLPVKFISK